jgi:hypothetical protein
MTTQRERHRLGDLLHMPVEDHAGQSAGHVGDVRFERRDDNQHGYRLAGIIVAQRGTGSLLGYDRNRTHGPWVLRRFVRWLHRHAFYVEWDDIDAIDWNEGVVRVKPGDFERLRDIR